MKPHRHPIPGRRASYRIASALAVMTLMATSAARTEDSAAAPAATGSEIERFCSNIADAARDQRYAIQSAELETLQKDIDARIARLEEKRAEYEAWLKRREDFLALAEKNLVDIYSKMRPDAASERMAALDVSLAASLLMKLEPKRASLILNEMELKRAAALTSMIASTAQKKDPS